MNGCRQIVQPVLSKLRQENREVVLQAFISPVKCASTTSVFNNNPVIYSNLTFININYQMDSR